MMNPHAIIFQSVGIALMAAAFVNLDMYLSQWWVMAAGWIFLIGAIVIESTRE